MILLGKFSEYIDIAKKVSENIEHPHLQININFIFVRNVPVKKICQILSLHVWCRQGKIDNDIDDDNDDDDDDVSGS